MLRTLWFILIIACVQASDTEAQTRIIKGNTVKNGVPYLVSVQLTGQGHMCGGAILDSKWILTSGYYLARVKKPERLRVVVGVNSLKAGGQEFNVSKVLVHPGFDQAKLTNNIALLELSQPIQFNDKVQPIPLPEKDTETGANVMVSGWGLLSHNDTAYPDMPKTINQTALSVGDCSSIIGDQPTKLCALPQRRGAGICFRDGGSPLVEGNTIVGVASFVIYECGTKYPDGYARVFANKDWIQEKIMS